MPQVEKTIKVSKEIDEVLVCVNHIVKHIKNGGSYLTLPAEVGADLMAAIQGCDQMDDEAREDLECALRTAGMRTGELVAVLVAKKPEAAAPTPTP